MSGNWFPGLSGSRYASRERVKQYLEVTATQAVTDALSEALQELDEDTVAALLLKANQSDLEALEQRVDEAEAAIIARALQSALDTLSGTVSGHVGSTSNPHSVTATQVGLGNVDNTSDADKPVSTATQGALNLKADSLDLGILEGRVDDTEDALAYWAAEIVDEPGALSALVKVSQIEVDDAEQEFTLEDGDPGQTKLVVLTVAGAGDSAVVTPDTALGWTEATLDAVGQSLTLTWTSLGWAITGNNGATVT